MTAGKVLHFQPVESYDWLMTNRRSLLEAVNTHVSIIDAKIQNYEAFQAMRRSRGHPDLVSAENLLRTLGEQRERFAVMLEALS